MQTTIAARHGQLSPRTQEKITEKVQKLRRYFDQLTAIEVTVNLEHRESPTVELRVSAAHTDDFVATDTSGEVMAALDGVLHKVEQQIRRHKDKVTGHRKTAHKHIEVAGSGGPETETEE